MLLEIGVDACTDVTGFGLLGHLREMSSAAGLDVELDFEAIPFVDGVRELAAAGMVPGGTRDNLEHVAPWVDFSPELSELDKLLLADAQTSGGLLIAVPESRIGDLLRALEARDVDTVALIGCFTSAREGRIRV